MSVVLHREIDMRPWSVLHTKVPSLSFFLCSEAVLRTFFFISCCENSVACVEHKSYWSYGLWYSFVCGGNISYVYNWLTFSSSFILIFGILHLNINIGIAQYATYCLLPVKSNQFHLISQHTEH